MKRVRPGRGQGGGRGGGKPPPGLGGLGGSEAQKERRFRGSEGKKVRRFRRKESSFRSSEAQKNAGDSKRRPDGSADYVPHAESADK